MPTASVHPIRRRRIGSAVTVATMVALLACQGAAAGVRPIAAFESAAPITDVQEVLTEQLDAAGISGGAVAVVSGGNVDAAGSGTAGGDTDVTADTPFVIGSTSKSFTALAVMQLVDVGAVSLDDPVRNYVPEFGLAAGEPVDDITVRHLLQHTSGLDDIAGGPLLASASDGTPLEAVAELQNATLASPPGETWRYANANFVLAGLVVERASGLAYGDYLQQQIFDPLGMTHSSATTDPVEGDTLADGTQFWFGVPVSGEPVRREATLAAGYLISTANDLGRYLSMYLADGIAADGTRVVSSEGLQTMLALGPEAQLGPWAQGQESRYAMGWFVGGPWGEDSVFHPGNTPDTTTMLTVFPEQDAAVAVVVNAGNELPVPGNPFIADRVTRNVVHAAVDQPPTDLPSLRGFYLVFDLVVLLMIAAAAWGLWRGIRAVRTPAPVAHPVRGWAGVVVRVITAGVLVLLPMLTYGWSGLWTWAPDLTVVFALLTVLLTATAVLRVVWLLHSRHVAEASTDDPLAGERLRQLTRPSA